MRRVDSRYSPQSRNLPEVVSLSPLGETTPGTYLQQDSWERTGRVGNVPAERTRAVAQSSPPSANVRGGSNDPNRGKWCTPTEWAQAVGHRDLDPFSNPYSHMITAHRCMLEDGGDGLGDGESPGSFRSGTGPLMHADETWSTWIQPDYRFTRQAFEHYRHTRWTALLRFDPRPKWWKQVYAAAELVAVVEIKHFDPPPGAAKGPGNTFPHAIYFKHAEDATPAVLRMAAAAWRKRRTA